MEDGGRQGGIYRSPSLMRRLLAPVPIAVIGVVVAIVALLAYGLASNEPDRGIEEALERGQRKPAPELVLPRLSGDGEASLDDYRGQVVVLNFWASWCKPCREESPLLQRWHDRLQKRHATVLGVDAFDEVGHARAFVEEYGLTYPMLRDGEGATRETYGILGFPETFVIDREGRIAAVARGPVDARFMRQRVVPLLREQA
jgi:cytochrome c biogenesis protein CcmG, thiol:disulfide interchange protein DsbE